MVIYNYQKVSQKKTIKLRRKQKSVQQNQPYPTLILTQNLQLLTPSRWSWKEKRNTRQKEKGKLVNFKESY